MLFKRRPDHPTEDDLSAYLDGELAVPTVTSIAAHLGGCEACATRLEGLQTAKSLLAELPRLQPSRSFTLGYEHALERRPLPRRSPFVFAPAVALTVFVALIAVDLSSSVSMSQDSMAGADRFATAVETEKATSDAAVPMPATAARNSAESPQPPPMVPAPATGGAGGEAQPGVMPFGAPVLPTADPGAAPQAAQSSAPPVAESAADDATSTASQAPAAVDLDDSDGGTDWLRLAQAGALIAFVVSLLAFWLSSRRRGGESR